MKSLRAERAYAEAAYEEVMEHHEKLENDRDYKFQMILICMMKGHDYHWGVDGCRHHCCIRCGKERNK